MPRFKATPLQCFRERIVSSSSSSSDDDDSQSPEPVIIQPRVIEDDQEKTKACPEDDKVEQRDQADNGDGDEDYEDSEEDSESEEEESSEEEWCPSKKDAKRRRLLRASAKSQNSASQVSQTGAKQKDTTTVSTPNSSANLGSIQTAKFLAQAAAVATVAALTSGGPLLPLFPSNGPPIAPLGLSLPSLPPTSESGSTDGDQKQPQSDETISKSLTALVSSIQSGGLVLSSDGSKINEAALSMLNGQVPPPKPATREKDFTNCSVCDKRMRRGSLREHMDRHANSGRFKCPICSKNFSRESAREKHIRTHTGERPYQCEFCSRAYKQKVHLNEHMRSHTGARPFICRLCGFSSASKSLLNRHLRTHGVRTTLSDSAEMWMKTDAPTEEVLKAAGEVGRVLTAKRSTDDEPKKPDIPSNLPVIDPTDLATLSRKYLCTICPAGFPTVQALRSHRLLTHNLVNPHKCPNCTEAFSSIKLMKVHLRKNHPQVCPICSQQMTERRRWLLEVHIRDEHPDVSVVDLLGPSPFTKGCPKPNTNNSNNSNNGSVTRKRNRRPKTRSEYRKWKMFKPENPDSTSSENEDEESETETEDSEIEDADDDQGGNERSTETTGSVHSNSKQTDADLQSESKDMEENDQPDQPGDIYGVDDVAVHDKSETDAEISNKCESSDQPPESEMEKEEIKDKVPEQIDSPKLSDGNCDAVKPDQSEQQSSSTKHDSPA